MVACVCRWYLIVSLYVRLAENVVIPPPWMAFGRRRRVPHPRQGLLLDLAACHHHLYCRLSLSPSIYLSVVIIIIMLKHLT